MASVGCITWLIIYLWIHVFRCEDQVGDILPFWDPEPKNYSQQHERLNQSNVQRLRKQRQQMYMDQWYRRHDSQHETNDFPDNKLLNKHEQNKLNPHLTPLIDKSYHNHTKEGNSGYVLRAINKNKNTKSKNEDSNSNVSYEDVRKSAGKRHNIKYIPPGRRRPNYKQRDDNDLDKKVTVFARSTRMTPLYLMQQQDKSDEEVKTHKPAINNTKKSGYDDQFVLNPYDIERQFKQLMKEFPGVDCESEILGRTVSYNNILLLKFKKKDDAFFRADDHFANDEDNQKKIVFIVHALSPMGLDVLFTLTVESYLKTLLSYYFKHLDKFDIYLMPLGNPDGYIRVKNRLMKNKYWHKNVSPQADCPGVDLDRNFDVAWNSTKVISSCDQHYPGPKPFSEPESKAVRDVLHQYSFKIIAYIHVHAGTHDYSVYKGDAVLYPKGYSDHTSEDDKYIDIRGEIDEAIKNANFRSLTVTVDTLHNWYGNVIGTSVDYASTVYGIPYAMEWVIQIRQDPTSVNQERLETGVLKELDYDALTEVWSRIIDSVFTSIRKKLEIKDDTRRLWF